MSEQPPKRAPLCPICRKPQDARFKPFCGKRCADVDLGRWLKEGYAVPAVEEPEPGSEDGDSGDTG
jgi:hypothetical protein